MSFHVGDRVRINLPEGVQWNKKTRDKNLTAEDVHGQVGEVSQHMRHSGQSEYKVELKGVGEFRFWERDLELAKPEPEEVQPELPAADDEGEDDGNDGPSEQIQ